MQEEEVKIKKIKDATGKEHLCMLQTVPKWVAGRIISAKAWVSISTGKLICYKEPKRIIASSLDDFPLPNKDKPHTLSRRLEKYYIPTKKDK